MVETGSRRYASERAEIWARAMTAVAWVAALFALLIAVLIIVEYPGPTVPDSLQQLKDALAKDPGNQELRERIRTFDLEERRAFFTGQARVRTGGWILLVVVVIFLVCAKTNAELRSRYLLPEKGEGGGDPARERSVGRWAVAAGGGALAVTALCVAFLSPSAVVLSSEGLKPPEVVEEKPDPWFCAPEAVPPHAWPNLRGPGGAGVASHDDAPLSWDGPSGKNIRWKVAIPRPGSNSPVVWENRVFLTGADKERRELYCFDADTGRLVWQADTEGIPGSPKKLPEVIADAGYAPSTAATDGKRIFAIFVTGDMMAFSLDGEKAWARNLGLPKNSYGHASSLIAFPGRVLVQYDDQRSGRFMALDSRTGRTIWTQTRKVKESWATPIVVNTGSRMEAILNADPLVSGHDPMTGEMLWSHRRAGGEVAPSAAYAKGIVFAGTEYTLMEAIRLGKRPLKLWDYEDDLPDISSPVAKGRWLFMASSGAVVTCLEVETGEAAWKKEYETGFASSPVIVGDRLYVMDTDGLMYVFHAGAPFKELSRNPLGEKSGCTPAFVKGRIYIRTNKHLYCIASE